MRAALLSLFMLSASLAACGGTPVASPGGPATACDSAMRVAAEVDDVRDTIEDLFPVVRACANVAEFRTASERFPEALDGVDPEVILPNLCANPAANLADTPICREVR